MTYLIKILLYSFLPTIAINLLTRPFWSTSSPNTGLAIFSVILTILILPIYLLLTNYLLARKYEAKDFILNGFIMACSVWLSSYFHFINWADAVGSRNHPDGGTEAVVSFEQWTGIIFIIIGTLMGHARISKHIKEDSSQSPLKDE